MKYDESVVFFIRRFNDVDHIAPIAYKMAELTHYKIIILSNNQSLDLKSDERLNFLINEYGVIIDYSYLFFADTFFQKIIAYIACYKNFLDNNNELITFVKKYFFRFISSFISENFLKRVFNTTILANKIKEFNILVAIFDWVKPYQHITGNLQSSLKLNGIPTISVPHGLNLAVNELLTNRAIEQGKYTSYKFWEKFDDLIVQFESFKKILSKTGFDESKISVIGSSRYCPEWREVYRKILMDKHAGVFKSNDKLKIAFMEYPYNYRINQQESVQSILTISKLDYVELIVKPHTRSNRLYDKNLLLSGSIEYDIPSFAICEQADIVIGTTSSILLDPLLNGKVFIYPKYFHENTMKFEEHGACWTVNSEKELIQAIDLAWRDREYRPYSKKNIDSLCKEVVLGGKVNRDVLSDYVDFIVKRINKNKS